MRSNNDLLGRIDSELNYLNNLECHCVYAPAPPRECGRCKTTQMLRDSARAVSALKLLASWINVPPRRPMADKDGPCEACPLLNSVLSEYANITDPKVDESLSDPKVDESLSDREKERQKLREDFHNQFPHAN